MYTRTFARMAGCALLAMFKHLVTGCRTKCRPAAGLASVLQPIASGFQGPAAEPGGDPCWHTVAAATELAAPDAHFQLLQVVLQHAEADQQVTLHART